MPLAPGVRFGVYEIVAPIGAGGMGQVWRAIDTTLGRQVAIKVLPDAFATDVTADGRFLVDTVIDRGVGPDYALLMNWNPGNVK